MTGRIGAVLTTPPYRAPLRNVAPLWKEGSCWSLIFNILNILIVDKSKWIGLFFMGFACVMAAMSGFGFGKSTGYKEGVSAALDTVSVIMEQQIKSDTSVSVLMIVNPDTNVFILSAKYPLNKK